ncbi:MAG: hypothetical protein ACOC6D_06190, partial [Atribacterota bacterium]
MADNILFFLLKKKNALVILFLFFLSFMLFILSFSIPANGKNRTIDKKILRINSEIMVEINENTKNVLLESANFNG